jgi:hypothetical protein
VKAGLLLSLCFLDGIMLTKPPVRIAKLLEGPPSVTVGAAHHTLGQFLFNPTPRTAAVYHLHYLGFFLLSVLVVEFQYYRVSFFTVNTGVSEEINVQLFLQFKPPLLIIAGVPLLVLLVVRLIPLPEAFIRRRQLRQFP